ncbi:hypothetical protein [Prosthecobacter sp.]|jgi:hypothetical protein
MNQVLSKIGLAKANIDISGASTARSASLLFELVELCSSCKVHNISPELYPQSCDINCTPAVKNIF